MLNYMLIKHKKIFERFSCFWKMFLFWNFQKLCNPVLVTCLTGQASHMPQSQAYIEDFHDSLVGQGPSHDLFTSLATQFGFLNFSWLNLATCSRVETLVTRCTQNVSWLPSRLSSRFIPIFVSRLLATCSRLISIAKIAWFAQWGSFSGQVSKTFHFPPHIL